MDIDDQGEREPSEEYRARRTEEQRFFGSCHTVHDLPDIFHYWSDTYIRPKLRTIGFDGSKEFFADSLEKQCRQNPGRVLRFVSLGSGNCDFEIDIAAALRTAGHSRFAIDCLDLSEPMLERGKAAAASRGLSDRLAFIVEDFNQWKPIGEYDAVIAIQSLHHVVNLEGLLSAIHGCLRPSGEFVVSDMIGRNGHLRWTEALPIVHEYWRKLPPSYRFNQQLKRYEELFEDWDCSTDGFEGIRSQDILPLLVNQFHFKKFIAYGNVIDPFVERGFGHHFTVASEWDRAFIDSVHRRDEKELALGRIKPTHMFAVLGTEAGEETAFLDPFTPSFCIRWPDHSAHHIGASSDAPAYEWGAWPQSPQRELEIACERLAEAASSIGHLSSQVSRSDFALPRE